MKKLIVLVILLALMPAVVPARGEALTLSQRVARLEAKLNCLRRVSVAEYDDVAVYGSRRRAQMPRTRTTPSRRAAPPTTTRTG